MANKIKKIIDCKLNENGQTFYLVRWMETWESAEKLEPFYHEVIEDFWEHINICCSAKDGVAMPARKRKRTEMRSSTPDFNNRTVNNQSNLNNNNQSLPYMPIATTTKPDQVLMSGAALQQMAAMQSPLMQPVTFFNMSNTATSPSSTKTKGRGRGRGRGRGHGQGRGSQAHINIKSEPSVFSPQHMTSSFPMFDQNSSGGFSYDGKVMSQFNTNGIQQPLSPQDVKPIISPGGQIWTQLGNPGNPMLPIQHNVELSPRGRGGRGRGRGRGGSNPSTPVKEEFKGESQPITGQALGTPSKSSSAPNLLSGDSQYDNWSNPYAKLVLVCRQCSKEQTPKNKGSWKTHYESHTDLKNFGCYVCEKRFRMKGDLKTHITRVHKEEFVDHRVIRYDEVAPVPSIDPSEVIDGWSNPYVRNVFMCKECSKELQWKNRGAWKTHYESHLDIKRFGCYVCQKPFRLKGDLKTHITRVHKEEFQDERVIRLEE